MTDRPSAAAGELPPVLVADAESFDALVIEPRDILVVAYCWGPQCPNCEIFARHLPSLLEALRGAPMRLVKIDVYTHDAIARRFGLVGIPAFLLFRDGRFLGKMSEFRGRDFWLGVVRERMPAPEAAS